MITLPQSALEVAETLKGCGDELLALGPTLEPKPLAQLLGALAAKLEFAVAASRPQLVVDNTRADLGDDQEKLRAMERAYEGDDGA